MPKEIITEAEKKLSQHMYRIAPNDADFRVLVGLTCRYEGLTEELVDYIEKNSVTASDDIHRWLFEEGRIDMTPLEVGDDGDE